MTYSKAGWWTIWGGLPTTFFIYLVVVGRVKAIELLRWIVGIYLQRPIFGFFCFLCLTASLIFFHYSEVLATDKITEEREKMLAEERKSKRKEVKKYLEDEEYRLEHQYKDVMKKYRSALMEFEHWQRQKTYEINTFKGIVEKIAPKKIKALARADKVLARRFDEKNSELVEQLDQSLSDINKMAEKVEHALKG